MTTAQNILNLDLDFSWKQERAYAIANKIERSPTTFNEVIKYTFEDGSELTFDTRNLVIILNLENYNEQ